MLAFPKPLWHPRWVSDPMALGMLYTCSCGARYKVYVPKQKLFRPVTGTTVNWKAVDAREEAQGDVAAVKRMADVTSSTFLDMREQDNVECPVCGTEMKLLRYFRSLLARSSREQQN